MDVQKQAHPELQKIAELIGAIGGVAMLTTLDDEDSLRSRPLQLLRMDAEGALWFFTSAGSAKVGEMDRHEHRLNLSFAAPEQQNYVSISGSGRIVRDRQQTRALWTPWAKVWFPQGADDPDLGLLCVTIDKCEYWDAPSGQMRRLFALAKALATGDKGQLGDNRKVQVSAH